jgi:hypothetical protein
MELKNVVPWGRSFSEYKEIFSLSKNDVDKKILGCGDGPASFNAELTKLGGNVVSIDPVYQFDSDQIRLRIDKVYPQVISQVETNQNDYVWKSIASVEDLGKVRMDAMKIFLGDYKSGKESGRYIDASLPVLPFNNNSFGLALCSHYLFLYGDHVNQEQHILSMRELCRVAKEVRVYPLLSLDGRKSKHLEPVISALASNGIDVLFKPVKYQFQKGATEMLVAKCV